MAHPNPITPALVELHLATATLAGTCPKYAIWDREGELTVMTASCAYGFPSVVIVHQSIGFGIKSYNWNCYDQEGSGKDYEGMFKWIADTINEKASGSSFALGTYSDIILLP